MKFYQIFLRTTQKNANETGTHDKSKTINKHFIH